MYTNSIQLPIFWFKSHFVLHFIFRHKCSGVDDDDDDDVNSHSEVRINYVDNLFSQNVFCICFVTSLSSCWCYCVYFFSFFCSSFSLVLVVCLLLHHKHFIVCHVKWNDSWKLTAAQICRAAWLCHMILIYRQAIISKQMLLAHTNKVSELLNTVEWSTVEPVKSVVLRWYRFFPFFYLSVCMCAFLYFRWK